MQFVSILYGRHQRHFGNGISTSNIHSTSKIRTVPAFTYVQKIQLSNFAAYL
jgi:hypothetical protein